MGLDCGGGREAGGGQGAIEAGVKGAGFPVQDGVGDCVGLGGGLDSDLVVYEGSECERSERVRFVLL